MIQSLLIINACVVQYSWPPPDLPRLYRVLHSFFPVSVITMPPSAVNKTTLKRINKEIADIQKAQKSGEMGEILLQPNESNMHLWTGWLPGPPGSPYEGGHFEIAIELPKDYP
jgi:hypothetical protein